MDTPNDPDRYLRAAIILKYWVSICGAQGDEHESGSIREDLSGKVMGSALHGLACQKGEVTDDWQTRLGWALARRGLRAYGFLGRGCSPTERDSVVTGGAQRAARLPREGSGRDRGRAGAARLRREGLEVTGGAQGAAHLRRLTPLPVPLEQLLEPWVVAKRVPRRVEAQ
jgi:hypothetical protein